MSWRRICDGRHRVIERDGGLIVWLSGTTGWREWVDNFRLRTQRVAGHRIKRVDWAEARVIAGEIERLITSATKWVQVCGYSRGGGLAQVVAIAAAGLGCPVWIRLYAPKRSMSRPAVTGVVFCQAFRGDVVPFLPPWLGLPEISWHNRVTWPWKAHDKAGRAAARWRHDISRGS